MKKNILIKGLAALLLTGGIASCSDDYLDVAPESDINSELLKSDIDVAEAAVLGFYRSMYWNYANWSDYGTGVSGEAWVQSFYGDCLAADANYAFWNRYGANLMNWNYTLVNTYWFAQVAWSYSYNLIGLANNVLAGVDFIETGTEQRRAAVKAQALAIRAHGYIRILEIYGARWVDSKNGSVYVAPLRLVPGTGDLALSTQGQIMDQIYADLTEAIELFDEAGFKRQQLYEVDKSVAQGLFARAAMLKNDWQKAYDMASAARAAYPIMSAEQYKAGFVEANQEYMWTNPVSEDYIGYWSWGSWGSCRGAYATFAWQQGAGAISYDLYKMTDKKDIRRDLYWTPDKQLIGNLRAANFWNGRYVNSENMDCNVGKNAFMTGSANLFNESFTENIAKYGLPYSNQAGTSTSGIPIVFGAQYKFWGQGSYAICQFPVMRGAEMALYEAEAAYRLGKTAEAQNALNDINSKRIEGYTCTKSGEDLWQEIMLTSRIELWGEGHSWHNYKRWNIAMDRRIWVDGDVNSNNFAPAYLEMHKEPTDNYGWVFTIPNAELQFNHAIDKSLIIATAANASNFEEGEEGGQEDEEKD